MKVALDLQKRIDLIEKYDAAYHNGKALISDSAYDLLKDSVLRQLPPDHPLLSKVGHAPSESAWKKERHTIFMGSQNKVDNEDDIRNKVREMLALVNVPKAKFVLQHKLDGFSLELKYEGARLVAAVTRGDGSVGENITLNAPLFRWLPMVLPIPNTLSVRAEGIITKEAWKNLQEQVRNKYENPRNAASGISRKLDGSNCSFIHVIAYDVTGKAKTETEKLDALRKLGFCTVATYEAEDEDSIIEIYRRTKANRGSLPYEIDGLVLKFDSVALQEIAGVERNRPLGQVALKFETDQALTTLRKIIVQVGRTRKLTPIGVFDPVRLMGTTISKASLHNFDYIKEKFLGEGAEVIVEKRGDIIPQIVEVVNPGKMYEIPSTCPSCGSELYADGVNLWCFAPKCRERDVSRITYWLKTIGVKGFSERFVDTLYGMGKILKISDLYALTEQDLLSVKGFGEKTIIGFFSALKATSEMSLSKFVTALGIPGCAQATSDLLVEKFKSWDAIVSASKDDLTSIFGIGEVSADLLVEGIAGVSDMAADILKVVRIKHTVTGSLSGKSFCVTGSLETMDRRKFHEYVLEHGGIVKSTVTSDLDYLVTNDPNSGSAKNQKAKKMGVKIMSEEEFLRMSGESPQKKSVAPKSKSVDNVTIVSENLFDGVCYG